jgi:hypothetical protein
VPDVAGHRPFATVLLILAFAIIAMEESGAQIDTSRSVLRVQFTVVHGALRADATGSGFFPSRDFVRFIRGEKTPDGKLTDGTAAGLKTVLLTELNGVLDRLSEGPEAWCERIGDENRRELVRNFSGSWDSLTLLLGEEWPRVIVEPFRAFLRASVAANLHGALYFQEGDPEDPDAAEVMFPESGVADFFVSDPLSLVHVRLHFHGADNEKDTEREIRYLRNIIARHDGALWTRELRQEIRGLVSTAYQNRGLWVDAASDISIASAKDDPKFLSVRGRKLRLVFLPFAEAHSIEIDKILYNLLPSAALDRIPYPGDAERDSVFVFNSVFRQVSLHLGAGDTTVRLPLLNTRQLQLEQMMLAPLGYGVTLGDPIHAGEGPTTVDLKIVRLADDPPDSTTGNAAPDVVGADPDNPEEIDPNRMRIERQADFIASVDTASTRQSALSGHRNYLGAGAVYRPGPGLRVFGLYRRDQLFGGQLQLQLGYDGVTEGTAIGDALTGKIAFFTDYIFFEALRRRRLSLRIAGGSDVELHRLIDGIETNERRSSGEIRTEFEHFRDLNGCLLRTAVAAEYTDLRSQRARNTAKAIVRTLDLGLTFIAEGESDDFYRQRIRVEAQLRAGLASTPESSGFRLLDMSAAWHRDLPALFAVAVDLRFRTSSAGTPLFERPSLGGARSLRGFRLDAVIARTAWSVQPEIWGCIPGTAHASGGFAGFLRGHIRLAAFVDVGGASDAPGFRYSMRYGPGAGLRCIYFPVVLKLDWAYGLGGAGNSHAGDRYADSGGSRWYFSIVTELP